MAVWQWSKTATSNGVSDGTMNWAEGIAPSIVNDDARAMMARLAEYRDDISGSLTTGGTSTAYTLTTKQGLATPTPTTGQLIAFVPHVTNGSAPTLQSDGGSAFPIQTASGTAIGASVLVAGTPYTASFNGTAWVVRDFYGNPFAVPLGAMLPFTGTTSPNANFVLPAGQAISRTTFAAYFALVGTTYGAGDGSTTFNVIDMRGCTFAVLDNLGGVAAGRIGTALVTDGGTINGQALGSFGGSQSHVQTGAEGFSHGHSGSGNVSDSGHVHQETLTGAPGGTTVIGAATGALNSGVGANDFTLSATTGVTVPSLNINTSGSSAAMAWLQPTRIVGCLLRVA
jgi:microcystin-dependent protein